MKAILRKLTILLLAAGWAAVGAYAQGSNDVKILEIKFDRENLPGEVRGQSDIKELNGDWYKVSARFNTEVEAAEVTVRFYVEAVEDTFAEEKAGKGDYLVLTGEQTYLNVPAGRGHQAAMFLDPMSLIRYGGKDGARAFQKLNIHVKVSLGRDAETSLDKQKGDEANWYEQGKQISGVLIGLPESPWWPSAARQYNRVRKN